MDKAFDLICIGTALVDSIIRGFDPAPVSASGFRAESGSLNVGGEAVNEAVAAARLGLKTGCIRYMPREPAAISFTSPAMRGGRVSMRLQAQKRRHAVSTDETERSS